MRQADRPGLCSCRRQQQNIKAREQCDEFMLHIGDRLKQVQVIPRRMQTTALRHRGDTGTDVAIPIRIPI